MLKNGVLTYISLFSSAGIGCYGFKEAGFRCIATNELVERRLDVQKCNAKCDRGSGYILGDISDESVKDKIYSEIDAWKKDGNDRVDALIATPPCQGISVINHKKTSQEINRNSLVVESIEIIKEINPRFFVLENVMAFEKTLCINREGESVSIGELIRQELGSSFMISSRILNFMNYGSNSSRTRTLIIGVSNDYRETIAPYDLFPRYTQEKTLREVIGEFKTLEWGEIDPGDFYHAFRTYKSEMRSWIHDLKEGQSAFDNDDPLKRPHRIVDGVVVENIRKNRDKYTRQLWDRFPQCIHTRNDQLAAQNTLHPEQDRVLSIRELMELMTVPKHFRWIDKDIEELNALSDNEKRKLYRANEVNIRQCLGEAVPTAIMNAIAENIKTLLQFPVCRSSQIKSLISEHSLYDNGNLKEFIETEGCCYSVSTLMRIVELCNANREKNAAFYTNKFLVNEIVNRLPTFCEDTIYILEPSVGAGSFIPALVSKYGATSKVVLDLVDIDQDSIDYLKLLLPKMDIPSNFEINLICSDFLTFQPEHHYDLAVGNPPFSKLRQRTPAVIAALERNVNKKTNNLAEMFLEKCMRISDNVALVLNKVILSTDEFRETRDLLKRTRMTSIVDFGRYGFTGVSIETIALMVSPNLKPTNTEVYSIKFNKRLVQQQSYITDSKYPYFLLYRDEFFDEVADKMTLGIFDVFRDRQITKANTSGVPLENSIWVLKAKNINDDGSGVTHVEGYDAYIDRDLVSRMATAAFLNDENVYLTPNMTYNPRVIDNVLGAVTDGSVAVLVPKVPLTLTKRQKLFFSTDTYRRFYQIARNFSTQSINVDSASVFFFGAVK